MTNRIPTMKRILGLDLGTTSVGAALIEYDETTRSGRLVSGHGFPGLSVRIFPDARDPQTLSPFNVARRTARLRRRMLRRRRERLAALRVKLCAVGLLPDYLPSPQSDHKRWADFMNRHDPYQARRDGIDSPLTLFAFGRVLYHLASHRQWRALDFDLENKKTKKIATADDGKATADEFGSSDDEISTKMKRLETYNAIRLANTTFGAWLAEKPSPQERRRAHPAIRTLIIEEFERLWAEQSKYHPILEDNALKLELRNLMFEQRPTFWRTNTLQRCPLTGEPPCAEGEWLSQQRQMLERLNTLAIVSPFMRPISSQERQAILTKLSVMKTMTWSGVRDALKPLHKAGNVYKEIRFNLEIDKRGNSIESKGLIGNALEATLANIFGSEWATHPSRQALREEICSFIWNAHYRYTKDRKRVVIASHEECAANILDMQPRLMERFGVTLDQARELSNIKVQPGWDVYSKAAIVKLLDPLESGHTMGVLLNSPQWQEWRSEMFPYAQRTNERVMDLLPTPADKDEQKRLREIRNPTVVRVLNEMRKVVNTIIRVYGKPDLIRVELIRDIRMTGKKRSDLDKRIKANTKRRNEAIKNIAEARGVAQEVVKKKEIEMYRLWEECGGVDPYSGEQVTLNRLFSEFSIEHIWPRSLSANDGFENKTICKNNYNAVKSGRTPYQAFGGTSEWEAMRARMKRNVDRKLMPLEKYKRFVFEGEIDFQEQAGRLKSDTGYAAREAVKMLRRLYPAEEAEIRVETTNGQLTAELRRRWGLNNLHLEAEARDRSVFPVIVGSEAGKDGVYGDVEGREAKGDGAKKKDAGEPEFLNNEAKSRDDHRHHAVDALVVACTGRAAITHLATAWKEEEQRKKNGRQENKGQIANPWEKIREEAKKALEDVVVSHRVDQKVSGPIHKGSHYRVHSDESGAVTYSIRKPLATVTRVEDILSRRVMEAVREWSNPYGGSPSSVCTAIREKKAYPGTMPYPVLKRARPDGTVETFEVRSVRVMVKVTPSSMMSTRHGEVQTGSNHHVAIYTGNGKVEPQDKSEFEVVSMRAASERKARREPVVDRRGRNGMKFAMSIAKGDTICIENGEYQGIWTVKRLGAQIVMVRNSKCAPLRNGVKNKSGETNDIWRVRKPHVNTLVNATARKMSVDAIGRMRVAGG